MFNARFKTGIEIISNLNPDTTTKSREVSATMDFSVKYIEQLIVMFKKAGLVESTRGPKGGFILTRPKVTAKDVYMAMNAVSMAGESRFLYTLAEDLLQEMAKHVIVDFRKKIVSEVW